jgi:hypothetical protein
VLHMRPFTPKSYKRYFDMQSFGDADPGQLTDEHLLRGRDQVLEQMRWTRQYSMQLIESIPVDLWYQQPGECL